MFQRDYDIGYIVVLSDDLSYYVLLREDVLGQFLLTFALEVLSLYEDVYVFWEPSGSSITTPCSV